MYHKSRDSPTREVNVSSKLSTEVVKFYNNGVVQAVTFVYLICWWVSFV